VRVFATALGAAFVALIACAPLAQAESRRTDEPESIPCPPEPGERVHDGFFARSAPGISFLWAHVSDGGPPRRTGVRGVGQSGTLSLGTTPRRGLVLGGAAWTARIDPSFVENGVLVVPDDDSVKLTMLRVGPFVDWYPNPLRGFHVLGSVGLAWSIESDEKGNAIEPAALGVSPTIGFGQEWFVASELSLGFVAQMGMGYLSRTAPDGSEGLLFVAPELALSVTFH
jgi:hypothetical protein